MADLKPGSKDSWGPKVWKILHNLAWISDRTDVIYIWKKLMKSLSDVMPCPVCRGHLSQYIQRNAMLSIKNAHTVKGPAIKQYIVNSLWVLHNHVNEKTSKLIFPLEGLNAVYENRTRSDLIHETNRLIREINIEWEPIVLKQITGAAFREWKTDTALLIGLISGGPN